MLIDLIKLVEVNAQDTQAARAALHIASSRGLPEMVSLLLHAGANPHLTDASNRSPLQVAQDENHLDIVAMLEVRRRRRRLVSPSCSVKVSHLYHVSFPFSDNIERDSRA